MQEYTHYRSPAATGDVELVLKAVLGLGVVGFLGVFGLRGSRVLQA